MLITNKFMSMGMKQRTKVSDGQEETTPNGAKTHPPAHSAPVSICQAPHHLLYYLPSFAPGCRGQCRIPRLIGWDVLLYDTAEYAALTRSTEYYQHDILLVTCIERTALHYSGRVKASLCKPGISEF